MTRRERLTLVATILASTVVFLDATVVNVALPAMERDLGMGLAGQQWVVEAYLLALVSMMLVGGSLGDHFGRRKIFSIGLAGFGVTSILCALAPSTGFLIAFRGIQGLAGALLVPGSLAIVTATFEGEARGRAIGTWTAWSGISTIAGPAAGGFLTETLSWRFVFWINVPLIVVTLLLTLHSVAESRDPDAARGFDIPGVVLSALGLGGPVFALIEQPTYGWGGPAGADSAARRRRLLRGVPRPRGDGPSADAAPVAVSGPQLRGRQRGDADDLRGADGLLVLPHPVSAAGRRATRRSPRGSRACRSR